MTPFIAERILADALAALTGETVGLLDADALALVADTFLWEATSLPLPVYGVGTSLSAFVCLRSHEFEL